MFASSCPRILIKTPLESPILKAALAHMVLKVEPHIAGCYGGLIFSLSFSLSRTSNFQIQNWTKRFTEVHLILLNDNGLLPTLSESSARELSQFIDSRIKDGLNPENLVQEISGIVNQSYSYIPQMIAVANQTGFKGLTPIQLISRALSERTDVPWALIFELHPALKPELESVTKFVKAIEGDPYAGIKYGEISQDIRNLLYLCV